MRYRHIEYRPTKRVLIHGGLWSNMNVPRIYVGYEEGCEYLAFLYGNEGSDPVIGIDVNLAGTRLGRLISTVYWRRYEHRRAAAS